jgi:hypothetical protein
MATPIGQRTDGSYIYAPEYEGPVQPGYNEELFRSRGTYQPITNTSGGTLSGSNSGSDGGSDDEEYGLSEDELNDAYDYQKDVLEGELGAAEDQYELSTGKLSDALKGVGTQVGKSKVDAKDTYETDVKTSADSAKSIERKNRNILRALGILGSSAAGEMLSKPWNQFDQNKAVMLQSLTKRVRDLDDYLVQKTNEHASMVKELEMKYNQIKANIQRDLSFNDIERSNALQQLQLARQQRIAEVKELQSKAEQSVSTYQSQIAAELPKFNNFATGSNLSGIQGSAINTSGVGTAKQPSTVGVYQQEKNRYGDLLSDTTALI